MSIVVVEQNTTVKELLSAASDKDLSSKSVRPRVQEAQSSSPFRRTVSGNVLELASESRDRRVSCGITRAMSVQQMGVCDVCTRRKRILVSTKSDWVGKVR